MSDAPTDWTDGQMKVVVNQEEQYSIWPIERVNPPGWRDIDKTGSKAECLACIEAVWADMRPLSLRQKLTGPLASSESVQDGEIPPATTELEH